MLWTRQRCITATTSNWTSALFHLQTDHQIADLQAAFGGVVGDELNEQYYEWFDMPEVDFGGVVGDELNVQ